MKLQVKPQEHKRFVECLINSKELSLESSEKQKNKDIKIESQSASLIETFHYDNCRCS